MNEEKLNEIEKRIITLEKLHFYGFIILLGGVLFAVSTKK